MPVALASEPELTNIELRQEGTMLTYRQHLYGGTTSTASAFDRDQTWSAWTTTGTETTIIWQQWVSALDAVTQALPGLSQGAAAVAQAIGGLGGIAERSEEWAAANQKAEALLREHLTTEQREQLDRQHAFLVSVSSGKRYKIHRGQVRNVVELGPHDKPVALLCAHPADVPDADAMLAQKLLLETDEAAFLKVANRSAVA